MLNCTNQWPNVKVIQNYIIIQTVLNKWTQTAHSWPNQSSASSVSAHVFFFCADCLPFKSASRTWHENTIQARYLLIKCFRGRRGNAALRVIPPTVLFRKIKILDDQLTAFLIGDMTPGGCGRWAQQFSLLFTCFCMILIAHDFLKNFFIHYIWFFIIKRRPKAK